MYDTRAPTKMHLTHITKICAKMKRKHWKQNLRNSIFRLRVRENGFILIPEINWKSAKLPNSQKKNECFFNTLQIQTKKGWREMKLSRQEVQTTGYQKKEPMLYIVNDILQVEEKYQLRSSGSNMLPRLLMESPNSNSTRRTVDLSPGETHSCEAFREKVSTSRQREQRSH